MVAVVGGIAVIEEMRVARMGCAEALCVLDRTPVLLGSGRDFDAVGEQTVSIGTKSAVEAFKKIEVLELGTIEDEVVGTPDLWDSIDWETYALIDGQEEIEEEERDDAGIDDGRG